MIDARQLAHETMALSTMLAMLVESLHNAKALDGDEFARKLNEAAASAETTTPEHLQHVERHDLAMLRATAKMISEALHPVGSPPFLRIIPGGRDDDVEGG